MVSEAVEAGDDGGGGKGTLPDGLVGVDWGFYGAVADADEEVVRGRRWVFGDCGESEVCWGAGGGEVDCFDGHGG